MRIYSRYLLKEMLTLFLLSLVTLLSIYMLVDFFAKVDNALENHVGLVPVFLFLLNQLPFIMGKFIPLALLLATMLGLGGLAQNNEIVAFQAGGLSIYRMALPLVLAGLGLAGVTFYINNNLVPVTSMRADHLESVTIKGKEEKNLYNLKSLWYSGKNVIYYFEDLNPAGETIGKALIYRFSDDHRLKQRLDIEGLSYDAAEKRWFGSRVRIRDFRFNDGFTDVAEFQESENLELNIEASFKDFLVPRKEPDRMTLTELKSYIRKAKSVGLSHIEYSVEIFNRILYPFSCPLMILLAIPFSLASRRHGGAARGIAISLFLGFSFWVVLSMSLALGQGRLLRPFTAAVMPYIIYGSFALFMLRQRVH